MQLAQESISKLETSVTSAKEENLKLSSDLVDFQKIVEEKTLVNNQLLKKDSEIIEMKIQIETQQAKFDDSTHEAQALELKIVKLEEDISTVHSETEF